MTAGMADHEQNAAVQNILSTMNAARQNIHKAIARSGIVFAIDLRIGNKDEKLVNQVIMREQS